MFQIMTTPDPDLLAFTPVPLQRRARGWTPDAQHAFIAALAQCGVVAEAARSVGCSPRSAYQLRKKPGAASFAAAWDWALELGLGVARDRTMDRINGTTQRPLVRNGRVIGHVDVTDHRLMLMALRALAADGDGRRDAMPHNMRIAVREFDERLNDTGPPSPVDWEAVDLPWFDRTSIDQGPDAIDAACRAARAEAYRRALAALPPPPPPDIPTPRARLL
jgi:hypothetical protein